MIAEVIPIPAAAKVVEVGKNEKHREILFSLFGTGFARGRMFDRRAGHLQSKRPSSTRRGHPPPPQCGVGCCPVWYLGLSGKGGGQ